MTPMDYAASDSSDKAGERAAKEAIRELLRNPPPPSQRGGTAKNGGQGGCTAS